MFSEKVTPDKKNNKEPKVPEDTMMSLGLFDRQKTCITKPRGVAVTLNNSNFSFCDNQDTQTVAKSSAFNYSSPKHRKDLMEIAS